MAREYRPAPVWYCPQHRAVFSELHWTGKTDGNHRQPCNSVRQDVRIGGDPPPPLKARLAGADLAAGLGDDDNDDWGEI